MAPEIVKEEKYNEKVDIWATGCLAYQLLTKYLPFESNNKVDRNDRIKYSTEQFKTSYFLKLDPEAQHFIK